MSKNLSTALGACLLLVVLSFHISIAWQDFGTLAANGYLYDDSFYAFQIARNIAGGNGISFDSIHSTTGFQPLYVFMLVPVYMLCGTSCTIPIHVALSLLSIFTTFTALLIYRIARRYVARAASLAAAGLWAISPIVTKQTANGLETAITTFMIALSIYYYLSRVRPATRPISIRFFILGIFLGLTVLSRIDSVFLVLTILLDYLLLLRKRKSPVSVLLSLSLIPLGVIVLYGPWLIFNFMQSGSALQDSGTATRYLSLAYASYFGQGSKDLSSVGPDPSFVWSQVVHSVSAMKVIPPLHILFRIIDKAGGAIDSYKTFHSAGNILGFILLFAGIISIARWRRERGKALRRELDFLVLFSLLLLASYSFYIFGTFFFLRYYYPLYFLASIYSAFFIQDLFDWVGSKKLLVRRLSFSSGLAYLLLFVAFSLSQAYRSRPVYPFYDIAGWIEENTSAEDRIGVFQAGTIGYLCDREVINLDGKVNREALAAMKTGCLRDYIIKEGIDLVVDHSQILEIFLALPSGDDSPIPILNESEENSSGWIAVRADRCGNHIPSAGTETSSSLLHLWK
ncbi:MAG: glycosyltransferase family 39 protein [Candidatus Krumholzibacteriota bacterium]|nr:glycosyltransferase family 39 protein [Candidatus Krumholzibacteriota bacterium]